MKRGDALKYYSNMKIGTPFPAYTPPESSTDCKRETGVGGRFFDGLERIKFFYLYASAANATNGSAGSRAVVNNIPFQAIRTLSIPFCSYHLLARRVPSCRHRRAHPFHPVLPFRPKRVFPRHVFALSPPVSRGVFSGPRRVLPPFGNVAPPPLALPFATVGRRHRTLSGGRARPRGYEAHPIDTNRILPLPDIV